MHNKRRSFSIFMVTALVLLFAVNAFAEKGGQCVQYVKAQRPGGYNWNKPYPVKKNGQPTSTKESWVPAKDIWTRLWVEKRGSDAKKDSVLIVDDIKGNSAGHAAIVTKVDGKKYYVRHSNWCDKNCQTVSTGYFTSVGGGKVTYNGGKTKYTLLGFIYKP